MAIFGNPQHTKEEILEAYAEGKKIFEVINPSDSDEWIYGQDDTEENVVSDIIDWLRNNEDGSREEQLSDLPEGWHVRELPEDAYRMQYDLPKHS